MLDDEGEGLRAMVDDRERAAERASARERELRAQADEILRLARESI